jgi:GAF domain-containing protein
MSQDEKVTNFVVGQKQRRSSAIGNILVQKKGTPNMAPPPPPPKLEASSGWDVMQGFLTAVRNISCELSPDEAAASVIKETCTLLQADRSTLFFVDADAQELILVVAKGANNLRFPLGTGIAGTVAQTGQLLNIRNAYDDARFSPESDRASGYKTRAVIAVPVRDPKGDTVAVLQCINKMPEGHFSANDELLLANMAAHVGVVLRNCKLYEAERSSREKVASVLEVVRMLHDASTSLNSLVFTLVTTAHHLVDADRCSLYLVDSVRKQLVVMQGDIDVRFPLTKGIAGSVASTGQPLVIKDAYEDARFERNMDKQSGYHTKAVLCMPIFDTSEKESKREVMGVLQLINKKDESEEFSTDDQTLMETLLAIAGPILSKAQARRTATTATTARSPETVARHLVPGTREHVSTTRMAKFREEEEEVEKPKPRQPPPATKR